MTCSLSLDCIVIILDPHQENVAKGTVKPVSKKVVHKAAEAIDEFIGNRIADKIVKPKLICDENLRDAAEIIISPEKR